MIDVRIGADANGMLVGAEVEIKYHGGAYPGLTAHSGVICAVGHYNVRNARLTGWEVLCNRPAHRAPRK